MWGGQAGGHSAGKMTRFLMMLKIKRRRSGLWGTAESEDPTQPLGSLEEERQVRIASLRVFCLTSFPSEQGIGCKGLDFLRETRQDESNWESSIALVILGS